MTMIFRLCAKVGVLLPLLLGISYYQAVARDKKEQPKTAKTEQTPYTFRVPVDVVIVNATATDKKGDPVLDLKAGDFTLFEDGKQRPIHTFTLETYRAIQPQAETEKKAVAEPAAVAEAAAATAPNSTRPRLISILVDDVTVSSNDYYYGMIEAVKKFIEQDMGPLDQVAIAACSGRVDFPFSNDKQLLLEEADKLSKNISRIMTSRSECPPLTDLQAQRIALEQDDGVSLDVAINETIGCLNPPKQQSGPDEESQRRAAELQRKMAEQVARSSARAQYSETQYRNRTLLQNLRQHIRSLKHFDAAKSIILFSDGFLYQDLLYELQDVIDQALRAGVVLNTIDIGGLYTTSLRVDERIYSQDAVAKRQMLRSEEMTAQEDPLYSMAHDTGGIFYHNSNDLHEGLQKISNRQAYYYVLTYATASTKADGRHHKIKLEVSRPGVELSYRTGYYAPKEELTFERRKKEEILEAFHASGNLNEIKIGLSYNYYQLDDFHYEVDLLTNVDLRGVHFQEEDAKLRNLISIVVIALDENDRYLDGLEKDVEFNLTPSSHEELLKRGMTSKVSFRLPPGRFKIKAVVRESTQSKIGSLTKGIEIP